MPRCGSIQPVDLASPVKRQFAGDDFDELKICVGSAVRRDASHHQAAKIIAKAPTSAAPLNAPRPAARPMSITSRFTIGQRSDRTFQLGLSFRKPGCKMFGPGVYPSIVAVFSTTKALIAKDSRNVA